MKLHINSISSAKTINTFNKKASSRILSNSNLKDQPNRIKINKNIIMLRTFDIEVMKNINLSPSHQNCIVKKLNSAFSRNINNIKKIDKYNINKTSNKRNILEISKKYLNDTINLQNKKYNLINSPTSKNKRINYSAFISRNPQNKNYFSKLNFNVDQVVTKNNLRRNKTAFKNNRKTEMISYSYKKLQNKIRKYFSISREIKEKEKGKEKENKDVDLFLFASPNDLMNYRLEKECLQKMNVNNIYFRNYNFFNENSIKEECNNNIINKKFFGIDKKKVIIPEFKNELLASLTNGKEFKTGSQNKFEKRKKEIKNEVNKQIKEFDIESELYEIKSENIKNKKTKKIKEKKENIETNKENNEKSNVFLTASIKMIDDKKKIKSYKRLLINDGLGENNNGNDKRGICVYHKC